MDQIIPNEKRSDNKNDGYRDDKGGQHTLIGVTHQMNSMKRLFLKYVIQKNGKHVILYRSDHLPDATLHMLNEMPKDVILVVDAGLEVPANKMILAASSFYFREMLEKFKARELDRVVLHDIDYTVLNDLVQFMYGNMIQVNENSVRPLLAAASSLQAEIAVYVCGDFLCMQLNPSNCFEIHALANRYGCVDLLAQTDGYMEHHFLDIVKNETFLKLSSQQLMEFISNDNLAVPSEEIVFESLMSWVKYKPKERLQYFAELMKQVRLPLIPEMYLIKNVWEEPIFKANSQCKDYLIEAMEYHLLKRAGQLSSKTLGIRPREPHELPKLLIIIGGKTGKSVESVEYFDFRTKLWHKAANFQKGFCNGGVTVLEGNIYAVGGSNLTEAPLRTMHVYDLSADHWTACTEMKIKRMNFGVVTLDDCIYAVWSYMIGGWSGNTIYKSAEVYNSKTCKWTMIPPMIVTRCCFAVAALNGLIYAIGGYGGVPAKTLSSVECYNPETGQWKFVADLNIPRKNASACIVKGILYVVGGVVEVEVFDPNRNIWTLIEDMPGVRQHAGVVCINEELYVVGGSDGTADLRSICVYNPKKRAWIIYPTYMRIGRSLGGVIAVDIPHNYI